MAAAKQHQFVAVNGQWMTVTELLDVLPRENLVWIALVRLKTDLRRPGAREAWGVVAGLLDQAMAELRADAKARGEPLEV
jgi:hypothetical protein